MCIVYTYGVYSLDTTFLLHILVWCCLSLSLFQASRKYLTVPIPALKMARILKIFLDFDTTHSHIIS
jgi:hypothetical protein